MALAATPPPAALLARPQAAAPVAMPGFNEQRLEHRGHGGPSSSAVQVHGNAVLLVDAVGMQ